MIKVTRDSVWTEIITKFSIRCTSCGSTNVEIDRGAKYDDGAEEQGLTTTCLSCKRSSFGVDIT